MAKTRGRPRKTKEDSATTAAVDVEEDMDGSQEEDQQMSDAGMANEQGGEGQQEEEEVLEVEEDSDLFAEEIVGGERSIVFPGVFSEESSQILADTTMEPPSGRLVTTPVPPDASEMGDGEDGASRKTKIGTKNSGEASEHQNGLVQLGPGSNSSAQRAEPKPIPQKRLLGLFNVPLKCMKPDPGFRAVKPERVKELEATFSKIDVNEMSSTFVAVTDLDDPGIRGENLFTAEILQRCLDDGKEEFLVCEAGNHRLECFVNLAGKPNSKFTMETTVPCRVYTNCSFADRLDLAANDNIGCSNTMAISFEVVISQLRTLMLEVYKETKKGELKDEEPLPKPATAESARIKAAFIRRFTGTTSAEYNSTVNRYLKFARYPEVEAGIVTKFMAMLDKKGKQGIAAIPGDKASIAGGTCKISIGKTALEEMMHYKLVNPQKKQVTERPWFNIIETVRQAVAKKTFAAFSAELEDHPVDPKEKETVGKTLGNELATDVGGKGSGRAKTVGAPNVVTADPAKEADSPDVDLSDAAGTEVDAPVTKGRNKRTKSPDDGEMRETRGAKAKKAKNDAPVEAAGTSVGSSKGKGGNRKAPTSDETVENDDTDSGSDDGGQSKPSTSAKAVSATPTTAVSSPVTPSVRPSERSNSKPADTAAAAPVVGKKNPTIVPTKNLPAVIKQFTAPTELEVQDQDLTAMRYFRDTGCRLTEMILKHPITRMFFGAPMYCTEEGLPSSTKTGYVRFRLYRIPSEFKLITDKEQVYLPVLDYGWIINTQLTYHLVHSNTDQHFNTNGLDDENEKGKKYGDHLKEKLEDCTVKLQIQFIIPISEDYYKYGSRKFTVLKDEVKNFCDLFDPYSFGEQWEPWPLNDPTDGHVLRAEE